MADLCLHLEGEEESKENIEINSGAENLNKKLSDLEKISLLEDLKNSPCLWKNSSKWSKKDRNGSLEKLCSKFCITSDGFKKIIHSLRTSMAREVKRSQDKPSYKSSWKFYENMKFLEEEITKSLQQETEWTEDETTTLIDFYEENPVLWNHCLHEYKDRNLKRLAYERLQSLLREERSVEDIKNHWHSLKTIFDREDKRQKASKKTGTGTSDVYKTSWKYFNLLVFTKDCADYDESKSTMTLTQEIQSPVDEPPYKIKKNERGKARRELESIRMELYKSAIESLKPSVNNSAESCMQLSEEQAFGRTIAQALTRFNARQKAIARKRIGDVLFEVELGIESAGAMYNPSYSNLLSQPNYPMAQANLQKSPSSFHQTSVNSQFSSEPDNTQGHYYSL